MVQHGGCGHGPHLGAFREKGPVSDSCQQAEILRMSEPVRLVAARTLLCTATAVSQTCQYGTSSQTQVSPTSHCVTSRQHGSPCEQHLQCNERLRPVRGNLGFVGRLPTSSNALRTPQSNQRRVFAGATILIPGTARSIRDVWGVLSASFPTWRFRKWPRVGVGDSF